MGSLRREKNIGALVKVTVHSYIGSVIIFSMKVILFIVPVLLLAAGLLCRFKPAKDINSTFGYRTAKSKSSQENWDKAQQLMSKNLMIIGAAELVITIIAMAFTNGLNEQQYLIFMLIMVLVQALGAVLMIPMVESKL